MYVCRGENKKRPTRNPVCIRENPERGVRSLPPQTKSPTYGPGHVLQISTLATFISQSNDCSILLRNGVREPLTHSCTDVKVTGYLRGCPSRKIIFARCSKCNNHKLYISTKLMKRTIRSKIFRFDFF